MLTTGGLREVLGDRVLLFIIEILHDFKDQTLGILVAHCIYAHIYIYMYIYFFTYLYISTFFGVMQGLYYQQ